MPAGVEEGIVKGMYLLEEDTKEAAHHVQLMGSGTILREVREAAKILREEFNVGADVWSVTSFNELRRDGLAVERSNRLHPGQTWVLTGSLELMSRDVAKDKLASLGLCVGFCLMMVMDTALG